MLEHCQQNLSSNVAGRKEREGNPAAIFPRLCSSASSLSFSLTVCVASIEFMLRYFVCWTQIFRFRRKFITITPQFSAKCIECVCASERETKHAERSKSSIYSPTHTLCNVKRVWEEMRQSQKVFFDLLFQSQG